MKLENSTSFILDQIVRKNRSNGNRVDDTLKCSLSCAWMWPSNVNIIAKNSGRANVRNAAFDVD